MGVIYLDIAAVNFLLKTHIVFQRNVETITSDHWTTKMDMRQLVDDSKEKLQRLVDRLCSRLTLLEYNTTELQELLGRYERSLQQVPVEIQSSENLDEGCDYSSDEEVAEEWTKRDTLQTFLDVEECLWQLQGKDNRLLLWTEIITKVRDSWLETWGKKLPDDVEHRLWQAWESNDSVWLLDHDTSEDEYGWLLPNVHDAMQQTFPTESPQMDKTQVHAKIKDRLDTWQKRFDSISHLYHDLDIMLRCWPGHMVRTYLIYQQYKLFGEGVGMFGMIIRKYHGCWYAGALRHQFIKRHDIKICAYVRASDWMDLNYLPVCRKKNINRN